MNGKIISSIGQEIGQAFAKGAANGLNDIADQLTKQAQKDSLKRTIEHQVATYADDVGKTWQTNITSGELGEATDITARSILKNNLDFNQIKEMTFQNAAVFAKANQVPLIDAVRELENGINPILTRKGYKEQLNLAGATQEEINELYNATKYAIDNAGQNKILNQSINNFFEKASRATISDINKSLRLMKETGKALTGNQKIDMELLGQQINNVSRGRLWKMYNKLKTIGKEESQIAEQSRDALIAKLMSPNKSVRDIITPYQVETKNLQSYSIGEAKTMLDDINYMLKNRIEIAQNKPFKKDDWNTLTKSKALLQDYLKTADPAQFKPLSKSNDLKLEGLAKENKRFIKDQTGLSHLNPLTPPRAMPITGRIENDIVGIGPIRFRKDEIDKLLDSGLEELPHAKAELDKILDSDNIPYEIMKMFIPPNTKTLDASEIPDAATSRAISSQQAIKISDIAEAAKNDIRYKNANEVSIDDLDDLNLYQYEKTNKQSVLRQNTENAIKTKDTNEVIGFYVRGNVKLKLLQMLNTISNSTLDKVVKRNAQKGIIEYSNIGKNLLHTKKTRNFDEATQNFVTQLLLHEVNGQQFATGIARVLRAYPAFFDSAIDNRFVNALSQIEQLAKQYKTTNYMQIPELIAQSNDLNKNQLLSTFVDIWNDLRDYATKVQAKFRYAQNVETSDSYVIPYSDIFEEGGEEIQQFMPIMTGGFDAIDDKATREALRNEYFSNAENAGRDFSTPFFDANIAEAGIRLTDETAEADFITNSVLKMGGEVGIEDYNKLDKFRIADKEQYRNSVRNITRMSLQDMGQSDIDDLLNLHDALVGKPKVSSTGNITHPDKYTITEKIANLSVLKDNEQAYDYLMDLRQFINTKLEQLRGFNTPADTQYVDQATGLTFTNNMSEIKESTEAALYLLQQQVRRALDDVSFQHFEKTVVKTQDDLARQGHIVDSTSLDYILNKGDFDITYLNEESLKQAKAHVAKANAKLDELPDIKGASKDYNIIKNRKDMPLEDRVLFSNKASIILRLPNGQGIKVRGSVDQFTDKYISDQKKVLAQNNWNPAVVKVVRNDIQKMLTYGLKASKRVGKMTDADKFAEQALKEAGLDLTIYDKLNRAYLTEFKQVLDKYLGDTNISKIDKYFFDDTILKSKVNAPKDKWIDDSVDGFKETKSNVKVKTQADGIDAWLDNSVDSVYKETKSNIKVKTQADDLDKLS